MKKQLSLVKSIKSLVYEDTTGCFKTCGRETCIKLIESAVELDRLTGFRISNKEVNYFGDEQGFVKIEHIKDLIIYCESVQ